MSNKKKKKSYTSKNKNKHKKILDGIDLNNNNKKYNDLIKDIRNDEIQIQFEKGKTEEHGSIKNEDNINEKIQSFISILFTIIVFILLILIIFIIYDKYIKKDNINYQEICKDYIKKDYNISEDDILNYIKNNRNIIYNIDKFDKNKIDNNDILNFIKYIIWDSNVEYGYCEIDEENCLDTKKEITIDELEKKLNEYITINFNKIIWPTTFTDDDTIRLYLKEDKIILTFKRMEFETLKHDIVDIQIDENKIEVIYALSGKINNTYSYIGYKKLNLDYLNEKFIIEKIETSLNN